MQAEVPLDTDSRNYNPNAEESRCVLTAHSTFHDPAQQKQLALGMPSSQVFPCCGSRAVHPCCWCGCTAALLASTVDVHPPLLGGKPQLASAVAAHTTPSSSACLPARSKINAVTLQSSRLDLRTSFAAGFVEDDRLLLFPVDEVRLGIVLCASGASLHRHCSCALC